MKFSTIVVIAAVGYALICFAEHLGGEGAAERRLDLPIAHLPRVTRESDRGLLGIDMYVVSPRPFSTFTAGAAFRAPVAHPLGLVQARR